MALQYQQAQCSNNRKSGGFNEQMCYSFFILAPHAVLTCTKVRPQYIYPRGGGGLTTVGKKSRGKSRGWMIDLCIDPPLIRGSTEKEDFTILLRYYEAAGTIGVH